MIHRTPFLDHEKLKDAREALLNFVDTHRPHGSTNNTMTIVFDAKARNSFLNFHYQGDSRVVFTRGESADDHITSLVEKSRNAQNVRVVSDDKELIFNCRSRGARGVSVEEFLKASRKKKLTKQRKAAGFLELSYSERRKINEELGKIWLK